jgi:hypothetical protein
LQGKKGTKKEPKKTMTIRLENEDTREKINDIVEIKKTSQNKLLNEILETYVKRNYKNIVENKK